jgi:hypothetical protein
MKKTLKVLGAIVLFAFVCMNVACSGKSGGGKSANSGGGKSINSVDELKAYLDKQPANSIDKPIKVAMKANEVMLGNIAKMLMEAGKYVILDLSGSPLKTIPELAFVDINKQEGCAVLVGITIPDSVTSIEFAAFQDSSLASVIIPNSVIRIGEVAFRWCKSLASVTIGNSVTSIGSEAFSGCSNLSSVTIPNSVTSIGSGAFEGCTRLTSVNIPDSVTSIEYHAFNQCSNLASVNIPNGVTSIELEVFRNCTSLTSITIPNTVTSIGGGAFYNCTSLANITYQGTIPSSEFEYANSFPGDLRAKFYATDRTNGTPGTYTRASGGTTWTRQ